MNFWPVHVTHSSAKTIIATLYILPITDVMAKERAFSTTWLRRRGTVWQKTFLHKLALIYQVIPVAVLMRFPSTIFGSRRLVLRRCRTFFVELNELVSLGCFKILDRTQLSTSLPMAERDSPPLFIWTTWSQRASVTLERLGILQKWLGQWIRAVTWHCRQLLPDMISRKYR